jgi:hypothetical protein
MPNVTTETSKTTTFQFLEDNVALRSQRNSSNPDKRKITTGSLAQLRNGQVMGRSVSYSAEGLPLFAYGEWDPVRKQADLIAAPDPVGDLDHIATRLEHRYGMHALPHQPAPCEADRFIAAWPEIGPVILKTLGLAPLKPVDFLFDPGRVTYPKSGLTDVRTYFNKHVAGDYGDRQYDPTPFTPEDLWLLGTLPIARQSDHAIQTGRGIIRSRYGSIEAVSILSPRRRTTLIFDRRLLEV